MSEHDEDAVVERIKSDPAFAKEPVMSILSQLKPGDRLPGGAGTVAPDEPSEAMLEAARKILRIDLGPDERAVEIAAIYRAMLAASGD